MTRRALHLSAHALLLLVVTACSSGSGSRFVDGSSGLPRTGEWRQRIAVADLDGDKVPEIIAPPSRDQREPRPHIWSRGRDGRWKQWPDTLPKAPYGYGDVVVDDFDGDHRSDLALANHDTGVFVLLQRPGRRWVLVTKGFPKTGAFPSRALAVGDLNGDGRPDLAAVAEVSSLRSTVTGVDVFTNRDGRSWTTESIRGARDLFGDRIAIADVRGDGGNAVIVGGSVNGDRNIVWVRNGRTWRSLPDGIPASRIFPGVAVCHRELFLAAVGTQAEGASAVRVLRFSGARWTDRSNGLPELLVRDVTAGPLFGRRTCDAAAAESATGAVHLFRFSSGRWRASGVLIRPAAIKGEIFAVQITDVDGDGHADVVANYASPDRGGGIRVWLTRPRRA